MKKYIFNTWTGVTMEYSSDLKFDFSKGNLITIVETNLQNAKKTAKTILCCMNCKMKFAVCSEENNVRFCDNFLMDE